MRISKAKVVQKVMILRIQNWWWNF